MHPLFEMDLIKAIHRDRVRAAERHRLVVEARRGVAEDRIEDVVIRRAADDDAGRLARLAQLDSATPPIGPTLVAELDGRLVAALPLHGGRAVADPFVPSEPLVRMLELRAAQVAAVA